LNTILVSNCLCIIQRNSSPVQTGQWWALWWTISSPCWKVSIRVLSNIWVVFFLLVLSRIAFGLNYVLMLFNQ
jgi:hypothetical protein